MFNTRIYMEGYISDNYKFVYETIVSSFDVDHSRHMSPPAFMYIAQEIAYNASTAFNFGYDYLSGRNHAWVLSRMHIRFRKFPEWREEIVASTWHKRAYGPYFLRDFYLKDKDGNILIESTSSWVIMDTVTRTLVKGEHTDVIPQTTNCTEEAIAEPAGKVVIPRDAEVTEAGVHEVVYSDIDLLGHTNNVKYLWWALDCLPQDVVFGKPLKELTINFNHETRLGDKVSLKYARQEVENREEFVVEGSLEGKSAFTVKLVFLITLHFPA